MDRFMIAPFDQNSGLTKNTKYGIFKKYTKGCILKKSYKNRVDIIDITGQNFSDFTVIKLAERGKYRGANWLCKCKCGNECIIPGGHLRAGKRKSCGCRSEARIDEVGVNRIYSSYKRKALLRKINFNLDKKLFEKLIKGNCGYCGTPPSQILKRLKSRKLQILYNGIDRVNSHLGYTEDNCVSCCRYCNQSKSDLNIQQWKEYIKRIYKWLSIDSI